MAKKEHFVFLNMAKLRFKNAAFAAHNDFCRWRKHKMKTKTHCSNHGDIILLENRQVIYN